MARILIVEDNLANMKLASLLLRNVGHAVLCAADAETGLTLARTEQPDLILMDIQLPGMDGLAATALLKRDPVTAAIPVVALTAMAMKADQEKTRVAGCDAYIAKPLRYQELYAVIDALLHKGGQQAASDSNPFRLAPPLSKGQHETVIPPPSDEAVRDARLILVAEDSEINQKLILRQLALLGFSADVVGNGRLALERWQNGNYALLLSDLHMPEMDGYELTAAIRSQERGSRRIPIVALTANALRTEVDHFLVAGMDGYLRKPLQLADLRTALETWLPTAASSPSMRKATIAAPADDRAVDVGVLENLVGNDPAVIREFLTDFRSSAATLALKLTTACIDHQATQASEQAHKLMSSARSVGALALGELCAQMENAGKAGSIGMLTTLLPRFQQELDAVNASLDSFAGLARKSTQR